jgi:hypothetical protein
MLTRPPGRSVPVWRRSPAHGFTGEHVRLAGGVLRLVGRLLRSSDSSLKVIGGVRLDVYPEVVRRDAEEKGDRQAPAGTRPTSAAGGASGG